MLYVVNKGKYRLFPSKRCFLLAHHVDPTMIVNQVYIYIINEAKLYSPGGSDNENNSKPSLHIHIKKN